ncbi:DUF3549 domain-containing protein [Marinobacter guineae]|uniref:DUF3549 domain-containing protein n=1 Tax=Marinobacter guineae TaxID=432303 RepID=A0A2G1VCJ4_9GAMM|nr:DUF6279 family lipoprotein [Marinobacter guineae]PHQ24475.1 DUF3549 domain-containing protein [Marinobacter guineae]
MDFYGRNPINVFSKVALLLVLAVALAGCSSTKTAYRYADWGIVWWVEDYIALTNAQKQQLNADINNLRQWHCRAELPRYQAWLNELESDVSEGPVGKATVAYHQEQLFGFVPGLLQQVTPVAVNLLSSLSDKQVHELAENMEQNQQKMEEEFLAASPKATAEARADRTVERVERWLGRLNSEQRQIVETWSANRGTQTEIWLQGRRNWQLALLEVLERRNEPTFPGELENLIMNSEKFRGKAYEAMMAESRPAMASLMHDLIKTGDASTLAHLQNRASELNSDFESLTCSPA